ncbi:MAG: histidine triad nucleotide-binding protein [Nitrospiraceae bacterium]|nr:histidine triad nucleotide-binding protein [Nitrospiraceae bacterium]
MNNLASDCLFCRILEKKVPSKKVYEDALCYAFEDINPQAPVHVLVIPKKHISTTLELAEGDNALMGRLFQTANQIARQKGIDQRGFRLVMNTNPEAGQSVYHIHLHVLGGRHMHWPPG